METANSTRLGNREVLGERSAEKAALAPPFGPSRRGYGLPCAKCRAYYAAEQTVWLLLYYYLNRILAIIPLSS